MASWSETPVFDRRKQPRCVVCDGRGCEHCPAVSAEIESLSRTTIQTIDPTGKGALPCCPRCVGLLRIHLDHPDRIRTCDAHGEIPESTVLWIPYHMETA